MDAVKFTKGQSVTGKGRHESTRYRVLTVHNDGTVTVQALFQMDHNGRDKPGFLGHKYRCQATSLLPLADRASS